MTVQRNTRPPAGTPRLSAVGDGPADDGRSVFVTAGDGPVGRAAVRAFAAAGHGVTALVPGADAAAPGATPLVGQLGQITRMADSIRTADSVLHVAQPRDGSRRAALAHIDETGELVELWHGGTFVYLSTMGVYGTPRDSVLESAPPAPQSWSAVAAYTNERQIAMATRWPRRGGAVVLRAACLLDPDPATAGGLLPTLIEQVRAGRTFVFESAMALSSHGTAFLGARDLARALVAVAGFGADGVFNLASGFATWREMLEAIGEALGTPPRLTIRPDLALRAGDVLLPPSRVNMRTEALRDATGLAPEDTLEALVRRAADAARRPGSHLRAVT